MVNQIPLNPLKQMLQHASNITELYFWKTSTVLIAFLCATQKYLLQEISKKNVLLLKKSQYEK